MEADAQAGGAPGGVAAEDMDRIAGRLLITSGADRNRKWSAFWVLLVLAAIIASRRRRPRMQYRPEPAGPRRIWPWTSHYLWSMRAVLAAGSANLAPGTVERLPA